MSGGILLMYLIFSTFGLLRVDSIKCFQCTSLNNPACADPFGANNTLQECPILETREAILCRKLKQTVDTPEGKMVRVIRSCGYIPNTATERDNNCIKASFSASSSSRYCSCSEKGCNSADSIKKGNYSYMTTFVLFLCYRSYF